MKVFCESGTNKVISVSQTYFVDPLLDVIKIEVSHMPNFLELAVNHDCVRVRSNSNLLSEIVLLAFLGCQKGDGLADVTQG